ncbi:hypothetical protein SESBI_16218 [Sesbania bispinosa]|nr:hypothetical protein SESBI_16218 [Sesbania bispinosa]
MHHLDTVNSNASRHLDSTRRVTLHPDQRVTSDMSKTVICRNGFSRLILTIYTTDFTSRYTLPRRGAAVKSVVEALQDHLEALQDHLEVLRRSIIKKVQK